MILNNYSGIYYENSIYELLILIEMSKKCYWSRVNDYDSDEDRNG